MASSNGKSGHRWPKGVSGNPKGRPKKEMAWNELLRAELDREVDARNPVTGEIVKTTSRKIIVKRIVRCMADGDEKLGAELFMKVWQKMEGAPDQKLSVETTLADILAHAQDDEVLY